MPTQRAGATIDAAVDRARMLSALRPLRNALEPLWREWHAEVLQHFGRAEPVPPSTGMCRLTSCAVRPLMGPLVGGRWRVAGGDRDGDRGGYRAADGQCHPHYWLVGPSRTIVDFTADQFRDADIVVAEVGDPRYSANVRGRLMWEAMDGVKFTSTRWTSSLIRNLDLAIDSRTHRRAPKGAHHEGEQTR